MKRLTVVVLTAASAILPTVAAAAPPVSHPGIATIQDGFPGAALLSDGKNAAGYGAEIRDQSDEDSFVLTTGLGDARFVRLVVPSASIEADCRKLGYLRVGLRSGVNFYSTMQVGDSVELGGFARCGLNSQTEYRVTWGSCVMVTHPATREWTFSPSDSCSATIELKFKGKKTTLLGNHSVPFLVTFVEG